jgi:hypothetical protein
MAKSYIEINLLKGRMNEVPLKVLLLPNTFQSFYPTPQVSSSLEWQNARHNSINRQAFAKKFFRLHSKQWIIQCGRPCLIALATPQCTRGRYELRYMKNASYGTHVV